MITELGHEGRIKSDDGSGLADGIGDVIVVLVNIATRHLFSIKFCLKKAYNEIKDRKGLMKQGQFVKYDDLSDEEKARFK